MKEKLINDAMDSRFDGVETYVIVQELLELEAENKRLKEAVDEGKRVIRGTIDGYFLSPEAKAHLIEGLAMVKEAVKGGDR